MLNNKTWYTVKFKGTWVINMLDRPYQISRWGSKFQIYVDKRNELLKPHKDWISNDLTWIKLIWNKLVEVEYKCNFDQIKCLFKEEHTVPVVKMILKKDCLGKVLLSAVSIIILVILYLHTKENTFKDNITLSNYLLPNKR